MAGLRLRSQVRIIGLGNGTWRIIGIDQDRGSGLPSRVSALYFTGDEDEANSILSAGTSISGFDLWVTGHLEKVNLACLSTETILPLVRS